MYVLTLKLQHELTYMARLPAVEIESFSLRVTGGCEKHQTSLQRIYNACWSTKRICFRFCLDLAIVEFVFALVRGYCSRPLTHAIHAPQSDAVMKGRSM